MKKWTLSLLLLIFAATAWGQGGRFASVAVNSRGGPLPGANVAVCSGAATTAASVTSNVVTLTMAANPITTGFTINSFITVYGFTGADGYLNGTFPVASVTSLAITYSLSHANASASSNGLVVQAGATSLQACLPIATIYTDTTLSNTAANPFAADGLGNWSFYAGPGNYQVQIYGTQVVCTTTGCPLSLVTMPCTPGTAVSTCASSSFTGGVVPNATTFSNTVTMNGGGTITGTIAGNSNSTGTNTNCNQNAVLYVGGAITCWSGADIGAQINNAYGALPSQGGTIFILPPTGGGCYSYTTPIVFNTSNKYATLAGETSANSAPSGGACLNYTPTTATTAINIDYTPSGGGGYAPGNGLRDLTLTNGTCSTPGGCGSSATGVLTGGTNGGAHLALFQNVKIIGFGTGLNLDDAGGIGWGMQFSNFSLAWNTVGWKMSTLHENIHWFGGACAVNGTCFSAAGDGGSDVYFHSVSIDSNTTGGIVTTTSSSNIVFIGCHFENQGVLTALNYINTANGGAVEIEGGVAFDDDSNVSHTIGQMFTFAGSLVTVHGLEVFTQGRTITNVFNVSGGSIIQGDFMTVNSTTALGAACSGSNPCSVQRFTAGAIPAIQGQFSWQEQASGTATAAGYDSCYGDSSFHALKCSINNTHFHFVPVTEFGSCMMSSSTSCTFSATQSFSGTPLCFVTIDQASAPPATANVAKCAISGTTVTITAGGSNSLTWDALLIGNPD